MTDGQYRQTGSQTGENIRYIYIKYIYNHTAIERCFLKKARLTLKQTQLKPPISKTNKSKSSEQSTAQFSCFSSIRVAGGKGGGGDHVGEISTTQ